MNFQRQGALSRGWKHDLEDQNLCWQIGHRTDFEFNDRGGIRQPEMAEPEQPRGRQHHRVHVTLADQSEPGVDVAADRDDLDPEPERSA